MTTVDKLLIKIIDQNIQQVEAKVPDRDIRVLKSLERAVLTPQFITEKQANLLVKILQENKHTLMLTESEILELYSPTWSKSFRHVEHFRKLTTVNDHGVERLVIEFTFSTALKNLVWSSLSKHLLGLSQVLNSKYTADLTEKNIVNAVNFLRPLEFDIDEKLISFYDSITAWKKEDIVDQYRITTITNANFRKQLTNELGINTPLTQNIINDRSIRYNYFVEKSLPTTLTETIANRPKSKLWIDSTQYSLSDVFASLHELRRLPTLVVFEVSDNKKSFDDLLRLGNALNDNDITNNIGIYFRLPNKDDGTAFNQFIANNAYNSVLSKDTTIVGVQNGKLPKFLLNSDWKPMSIISIGGSLKNSKTSVYANCCDLNITYTDTAPLIETKITWLN